jgi:hypothetical protein
MFLFIGQNQKNIMYNKQQMNFIFKILFLFITLIYVVKQEGESSRCVDYSEYSEKTYTESVHDLNSNSGLSIYLYFSDDTFYNYYNPSTYVSFWHNQSTNKFYVHYFTGCFNNLSLSFSPNTKIIKILQKKNICHKSSDDLPALYV